MWCPKFRKAILTGKVKTLVEEQLETIAETKGYKILESKVIPDHIHLFIEANPFNSPTDIVKIFKGITSLRLFKKFPELQNELWRSAMESVLLYRNCRTCFSRKSVEYKAKLQGVIVEYIDPRYTSKTCSRCGHIGKRESKRFECP